MEPEAECELAECQVAECELVDCELAEWRGLGTVAVLVLCLLQYPKAAELAWGPG
jgi:hypothetical protein